MTKHGAELSPYLLPSPGAVLTHPVQCSASPEHSLPELRVLAAPTSWPAIIHLYQHLGDSPTQTDSYQHYYQ